MIDQCEALLEKECGGKAFLVPSCTAALEVSCAMVLSHGDEVIVPSWAHPANANAVIRAGGVPVFVDVDKNLNLDPGRVWDAITPKTKAIMPVHYAGVLAYDMTKIAEQFGLYVIEDAAQAIGNWKVTGDFGCLSFNHTKNVQCGEGGALIVKNSAFIEKAECLLNFGTTKAKYKRGEVNAWQWLDIGSSYVISSYAAEHLYKELSQLKSITEARKRAWQIYASCLEPKAIGNGHLYWFEIEDRDNFLSMARRHGATSHFDALHMTPPGRKYGRTGGPVERATRAMQRLVKLPTKVTEEEAVRICSTLFPERALHA
jgi:dTDP-4-amino-4,6-dideoxygalactose transaminase